MPYGHGCMSFKITIWLPETPRQNLWGAGRFAAPFSTAPGAPDAPSALMPLEVGSRKCTVGWRLFHNGGSSITAYRLEVRLDVFSDEHWPSFEGTNIFCSNSSFWYTSCAHMINGMAFKSKSVKMSMLPSVWSPDFLATPHSNSSYFSSSYGKICICTGHRCKWFDLHLRRILHFTDERSNREWIRKRYFSNRHSRERRICVLVSWCRK